MKPFLVAGLSIAFVLAVALVALSAQSDASRALPTSDAPFVQALRAEAPIDPLPVRSAAPTTAPSATVAAGGLPIASRSVLPAPTPMPRHARFLRGQATWWFSFGHGFYVAVNPSDGIPVGTIVTVCGGTPFGCLAAPATTTCACLGRDSGRIVDLSRDLFARFADPSRGVTEVVLEW